MTTRRNFLAGAYGHGVLRLRSARQRPRAAGLGAAAGDGERQARQDRGRAFALLLSRRRGADGRSGEDADAAGQRRAEHLHRRRGPPQEHGRDGDRHGGAVDQSVLVRPRSRSGEADRYHSERQAGRVVRRPSRPLRRFRLADAAGPAARRRATGDGDEETGFARGGDRRRGGRCRVRRSQIPPGLGEGRGTGRGAVHPPAGGAAARLAPQGQRLAAESGGQSAGDDDRACST